MKFLIDAQLPPALAPWIVDRGRQATHVFDLGLHKADDPVIWDHAQSENAIIISKDQDFVDRWILSDKPVGLVWFEEGIVRTRPLWNGWSCSGPTLWTDWNRESSLSSCGSKSAAERRSSKHR